MSFLRKSLKIPSRRPRSTFKNHRNELRGLDFITKVDGCRAANASYVPVAYFTLGSTSYSDTAAVTSSLSVWAESVH